MSAVDDKMILGVLASHYIRAHGLTYRAPDSCACGATTLPLDGDEDVSARRARAFAAHQVEMLLDELTYAESEQP